MTLKEFMAFMDHTNPLVSDSTITGRYTEAFKDMKLRSKYATGVSLERCAQIATYLDFRHSLKHLKEDISEAINGADPRK